MLPLRLMQLTLMTALALLVTFAAQAQSPAPGIAAGQWFDRHRSGHGLDINRSGNTLFGTFYTYDAQQHAEWLWLQLSDIAPSAPMVSGNLTRFSKLAQLAPTTAVAGSFSLKVVTQCTDGLARPGASLLLAFRATLAQGTLDWCLEPLLPSATIASSALDGHWFQPAMSGDSGWGLVTHFYPVGESAQLFHTFYFYDETGAPRWAVANGASTGSTQAVEFFSLTGSCFGCPALQSSRVPAGSVQLSLRSADPAHIASNPFSANLRFGNSRFERSGALTLLSAPRPVPQVRSSAQGIVQGRLLADGSERYSNIPYAAPPLANLRWRAPQPVPLRSAALAATEIGAGCLQPSGFALFAGAPARQSEDCLQLNIWQPANSSSSKLPVLVWIHGGGLTIGSAVEQVGSRLIYDGTAFAKRAVVLVSINYRLGVFGYGAHRSLLGEALDQPSAGNYGLLDQIAALRWVKENIAQFGGDPNLVTIFGESAGGVSTCALMAAPAARGLFQRAISQSGNCLRAPITQAALLAQGDRLALTTQCQTQSDVKTCLRAVPASTLLAASGASINLGATPGSGETYGLNLDGFALIESPANAIASGRAAQIPFMLGVNDDESTSTTPASSLPSTAEGYQSAIRAQFATIAELVLARYPAAAYSTPAQAYQDLLDDVRFTCANRRAASDHAARGNPVYHYALTQILPDVQLAALESFHGVDISFLFERLGALAPELLLREKMQASWVQFARTGDPGSTLGYVWPRFDAVRNSAELNSQATKTITDYRGEYCEFWARYVAL
jgi:para-nitrobenzyl esterase